jgi:cytoskeletal protein CcmA (bactofilin family)
MAIWKDSAAKDTDKSRDLAAATAIAGGASAPMPPRDMAQRAPDISAATAPAPRREPARADTTKESLISAGLTIEGKIQGTGHVRIAGQFNGDVHVEGNLTIEPGAKLTGQVRAITVVVGGELEGNIDAASRVELLETGMLNGDLKAASLTVAAGSRMRGRVEFGWDGKVRKENGSAS